MFFRNKINVKEAMEYVAKAWDLVTAETITNCWRKTGILPTINNDDINDIDDIDDIQQDELAIQENQKIIKDLLQRFSSIQDESFSLELNKYLETIDLTISTEQALTDIKIIRLVLDEERNKVELDDSESGNESLAITIQEGFNGLKTWIQYFEEQNDKEFNMEEMYIFRKYMDIMRRKLVESKKQKTITSFFIPVSIQEVD